ILPAADPTLRQFTARTASTRTAKIGEMNWRFRTIASVLGVFFFIPAFVFGQNDGALRGIVTAGADRSLLPQVEIEILSPSLVTPLRTKSANDGTFACQRLVPGIYTVRATHDGFQPRQIEL